MVRQGDHLAAIAQRMGFDAAEVWQHAANAELRDRREHGDELFPGDVLMVPEPRPPSRSRIQPRGRHSFSGARPPMTVKLRVVQDGEPVKDTSFRADIGARAPLEVRSDGDGLLTLEIPVQTQRVLLSADEPKLLFRVMVGHLDPIDEPSGTTQRLQNLGHAPPSPEASDENKRLHLTHALRSFQASQSLPETGELDNDTRAALRGAHGR